MSAIIHYLCKRQLIYTNTPETMELPKDPMMLYSVINMKLRDTYPSLDALCNDLQVNKQDIIATLAKAGFEYSAKHNKFW